MIEDKQVPLIGGVNLLTDPLRIDDSEAVRLKNLYPSAAGKLSKRKGPIFSWFIENGTDQATHVPVNIWHPKFSPNTFIAIVLNPTTMVSTVETGRVGDLVNAIYRALPETPVGYRPAMLEYGKRVLVLAGACDPATGASVYEVTDPAGVLTISEAPVRFTVAGGFVAPKCICTYQGRVVYGNFGGDYENVFIFADSKDQPYKVNAGASTTVDVTRAGGRSLILSGLQGDACVVMGEVSIKPVGAPDAAALFVLGSEVAIIIPGDPLLTDDVPATGEDYSGTLSPQIVNYPCGCVSADTFVRTPMGVLWASWNDVWAMSMGGVPQRVGTKIRPALTAGQADARFTWHAVYHHDTGSYRLAVVAGDQEVNGLAQPCKDQWWLDLRFGIPQDASLARWYGPQQYVMHTSVDTAPTLPGSFYMRTVEVAGAASKLYGVHVCSRTGAGFITGTRLPVIVEHDAQTGRDNANVVAPSIAGTIFIEILPSQQWRNEIVWEVLTKEYDFENPVVDKIFQNLDLALWTSDVSTLEAQAIVDGGRQIETMFIYPDQLAGFIASVDPIGFSRITHQYAALRIQPDAGARPTGKVIQLRLKDAFSGGVEYGVTVDDTGIAVAVGGINSQIVVYTSVGGVPGVSSVIDIPPGFYSSRVAFLTALCAALTASNFGGVSAVFSASVGTPTTLLPVVITNNVAQSWFWRTDMAAPIPVTDASSEFDKSLRRSRKVAAMLGFYEVADTASVTKTAVNNVALTISAHAELASARISVYHFQRKPSGGTHEPNIP